MVTLPNNPVLLTFTLQNHKHHIHISDPKYRRLISKSAFMQFLAILTFLHIWKNESQGYLKIQGSW